MTGYSVPAAVMAGISAYAAMLFTGFYFVLSTAARRRARREYLTFALMCIAVMTYDITCVGLYNARSLAEGIAWQRGNLSTSALIGVTYVLFTWDFLKEKLTGAARLFVVILSALSPLVAFTDGEWTLTAANPDVKHVAVGRWISVTYYEGHPGFVCDVLFGTFFVAYIYAVFHLLRFFRAKRQRGIAPFLVAMVASFAAAMNDSLVSGGAYEFVYLFEYGFAMILMAMGYALFLRFAELHEEVETLNEGLARTNADLVVALTQARESARVKTEFLASISHELRTPLNAIINLPEGISEEFVKIARARCEACEAEFELEQGDTIDEATPCPSCGARGRLKTDAVWRYEGEGDRSRHHLQTVSRSGRHLLGLVNDILDASKLELGRTSLSPEAIDVDDLVAHVADSVRALAEKKEVTLAIGGAIGDGRAARTIFADRVKISQVLYNLLGNAIKFSPARSTVDVEVTTRDRDHVLLTVRDRGIGIAKADQEIIFEKFRQADGGSNRAYGGTGLGLAISKSLVELHGGRIWVESERGAGATFFVLLPRGDAPQTGMPDETGRASEHDERARDAQRGAQEGRDRGV